MIEYTVKVFDSGTKHWFFNGRLHREDGPAVENFKGKSWWLNGERHREDGPAVECADGTKSWWLNGIYLTEEEFNARTKSKELTINEIEQLLGYKIKVIGND